MQEACVKHLGKLQRTEKCPNMGEKQAKSIAKNNSAS